MKQNVATEISLSVCVDLAVRYAKERAPLKPGGALPLTTLYSPKMLLPLQLKKNKERTIETIADSLRKRTV